MLDNTTVDTLLNLSTGLFIKTNMFESATVKTQVFNADKLTTVSANLCISFT